VSRRVKFLFGSLVIVAAVGTLIYAAVRETSAYFMTVEEYAADPGAHAGKPLRLAGRVRDGTVDWNPATLDLAFTIQPIPPQDGRRNRTRGGRGRSGARRQSSDVAGPLQSAFSRTCSQPVATSSSKDEWARRGRANALLTTCPSKYEAGVPREAQADAASAASG
jgi:hypothetical protein